MSGIISNILRSGMMLLGTWLSNSKGIDQSTIDEGIKAILDILGVIIASGGAVWSLLRSVRRAKDGVE